MQLDGRRGIAAEDAATPLPRLQPELIDLARLRRREARRVAAWLAMLGLLLQLWLPPLIHRPAAAAGALPWLANAICGVVGHAAPADDGSAPAPLKPALCPICLALSLDGVLLLPALGTLILTFAVLLAADPARALPRRAAWRGFAALPRPPPVTV